ncbi:hypothetical protein B0H14DRAFT_3617340 [Mycena olivaceomarginata]|nr:hypothetical protein B0H14DRAFT_3617340 [Mycena olivaceomarginata]
MSILALPAPSPPLLSPFSPPLLPSPRKALAHHRVGRNSAQPRAGTRTRHPSPTTSVSYPRARGARELQPSGVPSIPSLTQLPAHRDEPRALPLPRVLFCLVRPPPCRRNKSQPRCADAETPSPTCTHLHQHSHSDPDPRPTHVRSPSSAAPPPPSASPPLDAPPRARDTPPRTAPTVFIPARSTGRLSPLPSRSSPLPPTSAAPPPPPALKLHLHPTQWKEDALHRARGAAPSSPHSPPPLSRRRPPSGSGAFSPRPSPPQLRPTAPSHPSPSPGTPTPTPSARTGYTRSSIGPSAAPHLPERPISAAPSHLPYRACSTSDTVDCRPHSPRTPHARRLPSPNVKMCVHALRSRPRPPAPECRSQTWRRITITSTSLARPRSDTDSGHSPRPRPAYRATSAHCASHRVSVPVRCRVASCGGTSPDRLPRVAL